MNYFAFVIHFEQLLYSFFNNYSKLIYQFVKTPRAILFTYIKLITYYDYYYEIFIVVGPLPSLEVIQKSTLYFNIIPFEVHI